MQLTFLKKATTILCRLVGGATQPINRDANIIVYSLHVHDSYFDKRK